jgi:hypothetical protein
MAFYDVLPGGTVCPKIEVMFDTGNPTAVTHNYTNDLTPYLVSYSRSPVRSNEFDQPGPATATITLRNDDARFIPDNANGPYFGSLLPYRPIRIRAQWAGVTYGRFQGYILDWPQTWAQAGMDNTVTLQLVDELVQLESLDLAATVNGGGFITSLTGARITSVLQTPVYQPSRTIDAGLSTLPATGAFPTNSFALQHLRDVSASENGVLFCDLDGSFKFHDRAHRSSQGNTRSVNVQATIGDGGPGEIPYVDPAPRFGDVWPVCQVTPAGGSVQVSTGSTAYFPRTLNFPVGGTYLVTNTLEALSAAQYMTNRYSNPKTRVDQVTLVPAAQRIPDWATVLSLSTSDRVVFKRRFNNKGVPAGTLSIVQFVEGVGDQVQVGKDWRITLPMSPADLTTYWALGVTNYGELGVATRLSY